MNYQLKEKNWLKLVHKQGHWPLWFRESFEANYNIGFGIPIEFLSQRRREIIKSVHKQGNWTFQAHRVI